jgi:hypothetical protein
MWISNIESIYHGVSILGFRIVNRVIKAFRFLDFECIECSLHFWSIHIESSTRVWYNEGCPDKESSGVTYDANLVIYKICLPTYELDDVINSWFHSVFVTVWFDKCEWVSTMIEHWNTVIFLQTWTIYKTRLSRRVDSKPKNRLRKALGFFLLYFLSIAKWEPIDYSGRSDRFILSLII